MLLWSWVKMGHVLKGESPWRGENDVAKGETINSPCCITCSHACVCVQWPSLQYKATHHTAAYCGYRGSEVCFFLSKESNILCFDWLLADTCLSLFSCQDDACPVIVFVSDHLVDTAVVMCFFRSLPSVWSCVHVLCFRFQKVWKNKSASLWFYYHLLPSFMYPPNKRVESCMKFLLPRTLPKDFWRWTTSIQQKERKQKLTLKCF